MKRSTLILLAAIGIIFSSCDVYFEEEPVVIIEHRYDERDAFVGLFDTDEYSETFDVESRYNMRIVKSAEYYNSVYIRNFYGVDIEVIADINGDYLTIPRQEVDGYEIKGSGVLYGNRLEIDYTVIDFVKDRLPKDYVEVTAYR